MQWHCGDWGWGKVQMVCRRPSVDRDHTTRSYSSLHEFTFLIGFTRNLGSNTGTCDCWE